MNDVNKFQFGVTNTQNEILNDKYTRKRKIKDHDKVAGVVFNSKTFLG